jgi:hypothetical protein
MNRHGHTISIRHQSTSARRLSSSGRVCSNMPQGAPVAAATETLALERAPGLLTAWLPP